MALSQNKLTTKYSCELTTKENQLVAKANELTGKKINLYV